ncbi:hypothetical protein MFUR16E_04500 [Methylobacterium fujisawaense]|uniref:hypothetical protein n=1 Tax=Methylobacterium fujisawaense TaxID=107400 RepID=UPI002F2C39DB
MSAGYRSPNGQQLVCLDDGEPITLTAFYEANVDGIEPGEQADIEAELWMLGEVRFGGGASPEFTLRLVG